MTNQDTELQSKVKNCKITFVKRLKSENNKSLRDGWQRNQ